MESPHINIINVQSSLDTSITDMSKYSYIRECSFEAISISVCILTPVKFSNTGKFIMRHQWFQINFDFELSRVDCSCKQLYVTFSVFQIRRGKRDNLGIIFHITP